jgi:hypothetical protein
MAIAICAAGWMAVVLAGCRPERLVGPSVSVRNDSGRPIVVRMEQSKYEIGLNESRRLPYLYAVSSNGDGVAVDILDAASCEVFEAVTVSFESDLDPLLTVPRNGTPTQSAQTVEDKRALGLAALESRNVCQGPADGWTISVNNPSSETYHLVMYDAAAKAVSEAKVWPRLSRTLRLRNREENSDSGSIVLLDADCHVLDRVEHAAWGDFVMTIKAGKMTIEDGPVPADDLQLALTGWLCPPTTSLPSSR